MNDGSTIKHLYYSLDVSDCKAVSNFSNWLQLQNFHLAGLVNCAGIYGPIGKIAEIDIGKFTDAIKINFLGTTHMCALITPLLKPDSRTKIINYSGGGAASPFPFYSAYAASKVAIVRLTENLATELEDYNLDINCISPGFVNTRLHQDTINAGPENSGSVFYKNTIEQINGKSVPPEIAAELTIFLLSHDSDFITGKFISAPWDDWKNKTFQDKLRNDRDFATIRRIDGKYFTKIEK